MKEYAYYCDAGSIMIGNADFRFRISNGVGDGRFYVYITDSWEETESIIRGKEFEVIGDTRGKFDVYGYDCNTDLILCVLEGRYMIYTYSGTVVFGRY